MTQDPAIPGIPDDGESACQRGQRADRIQGSTESAQGERTLFERPDHALVKPLPKRRQSLLPAIESHSGRLCP
jgi:hypothetical protein